MSLKFNISGGFFFLEHSINMLAYAETQATFLKFSTAACFRHISCVFERAGGRAVSPDLRAGALDEGPSSRSRTEKPANRSPQEHLAKGG